MAIGVKEKFIVLIDCNNFYVSCEKVFNPSLDGKPIVVLSNNDGCIISRSDEAQKLGIKMGIPVFELDKSTVSQLTIFSANYTLYGDISFRIMDCLSQFAPAIEIYSIDEAFLDITGMKVNDFSQYLKNIRKTVLQWTGIPVTISLAPNKTLAKAGNFIAKKNKALQGTWNYFEQYEKNTFLRNIPVDEIWGIGEGYSKIFNKNNLFTAYDLQQADPFFLRDQTNVMVQRIINELNGIFCFPLDSNPARKKEICISRSYGKNIESLEELLTATSNFAARVGEKLRLDHSLTQSLIVFIMTNKFSHEPRYANYSIVKIEQATNDTNIIIKAVSRVVRDLYRPGYKYKKSGVIANNIIPEAAMQKSLFTKDEGLTMNTLANVVDIINIKQGKGKIRYAIQGFNNNWKNRQDRLSPQYTTRWKELLNVPLD